ncbi:hypothetical protein GQ457_02G003430 [Hibiscus cannabinus]
MFICNAKVNTVLRLWKRGDLQEKKKVGRKRGGIEEKLLVCLVVQQKGGKKEKGKKRKKEAISFSRQMKSNGSDCAGRRVMQSEQQRRGPVLFERNIM